MKKSESDLFNAVRWTPRTRGHYEVWYLTLLHRPTRHAFWIRYTLHESLSLARTACLWFVRFAPREQGGIQAFRQEISWDRFFFSTSPFELQIGDAQLSNSRASGCIQGHDGKVEWDLSFPDCGPRWKHLPGFLYGVNILKTKVVSPHLDLPVVGRIEMADHTYEFHEDPGEQSHVWGRKHGHEWCWGHCNAFDESGIVFEGIAGRLWDAGPWLSLFFLKTEDQEFFFNDLKGLWRRHSLVKFPEWSFSARSHRMVLEGKLEAPSEAWIRAQYRDPDGEELSCYNTERASFSLRMDIPGQTPRMIHCRDGAALEFGVRRSLSLDWSPPVV